MRFGIFFFKLGKKSPKSHWERGRISAPEDTKKIPARLPGSALRTHVESLGKSLAMTTSVLKALPGKLDIKRHSPSIIYISASLVMSTSVRKAWPGKLDIKRHSPSILYISASLAMSTRDSKPGLVNLISKDTQLVSSISQQAKIFCCCCTTYSCNSQTKFGWMLCNNLGKDSTTDGWRRLQYPLSFFKKIVGINIKCLLNFFPNHMLYLLLEHFCSKQRDCGKMEQVMRHFITGTFSGSLMRPERPKLASLAKKICVL